MSHITILRNALRMLYNAVDSSVELTPEVMRAASAALAATEGMEAAPVGAVEIETWKERCIEAGDSPIYGHSCSAYDLARDAEIADLRAALAERGMVGEPVAWISVKDRMPREGDAVITYRPSYGDKIVINRYWCDYDASEEGGVTHWMPAPSFPGTIHPTPASDGGLPVQASAKLPFEGSVPCSPAFLEERHQWQTSRINALEKALKAVCDRVEVEKFTPVSAYRQYCELLNRPPKK